MRLLYVVDPLDTLNLETETSLLIMEEAARRGHENRVATVADLYLADRGGEARSRRIDLLPGETPFYRLGAEGDGPLAAFDVVLMRKDPPVDEAYIAATHVLEHAGTRVVNDPVALRSLNEKLLPLLFDVPTPPSLVTSDPRRARDFVAAHGRAVLKPLNDCSGRGISILASPAEVPEVLPGGFALVQRFLDGVAAGDKRIYLLEGRAIGAVNRVPRDASALANIHQGARVEPTALTAAEQRIVAVVGPALVRQGIWMAGLDVIDGHLTEVNITSPSAARQINAVSGAHIERDLVDFLESAIAPAPKR
jgi:glutathione synthase